MNRKRKTLQRQLVLDAVKELDIHATAEQVYVHVIQKHPTISKATVYRNLSRLVESEELLYIGTFHGSAHYDHNLHDHYHFLCDGCQRVFDVEGDFSDIVCRVKGTHGFDINNCQLSFSGICWECKA